MVNLQLLNQMSEQDFIDTLGEIYERAAWVAAGAADSRPFKSIDSLHQSMAKVVQGETKGKKLELIRAHPNLGDSMEMSVKSQEEQQGAGLNDLSPEELEKFRAMNQLYMDQFDFPFIIAVKGKDKNTIYQAMEKRIRHSSTEEFETALLEIHQIAFYRLQDKIREENTYDQSYK